MLKNRANERFNPEELDKLLLQNNLEELKTQLLKIFWGPCALSGFKNCDKYIFAFPEEEIKATPYLSTAAAIICSIYGDLNKAREYAQCVDQIEFMRLHLDIIIPARNNNKFWHAVRKLSSNADYMKPNLPIAAGRVSLINGFRDLSEYRDFIKGHKGEVKKCLSALYGDSAIGMYEVAYAEICYMEDDCFGAIASLVGNIPIIEQNGEVAVLFAALYLQMRIMIATGQIAVLYPMLDNIYNKITSTDSRWLTENHNALRAWGAMYDNDITEVKKWLENESPNEYGRLCMTDVFRYMIKMRAYLIEGKYYSVVAIGELLRKILQDGHRVIDLCELNLLCAIAYYSGGKCDEAYGLMDEVIKVAKKRKLDRLIADEGEKAYLLLRDYKRNRNNKDVGLNSYINHLIALSKKMALLYPDYLKECRKDFPSLTETEREVLQLMANERTNSEIADFMGISINTVKFHSKNIYKKLSVNNRRRAVKVAKENNIL